MISRSAEHCFWLCRHLERINHIARFMSVNSSYILDTNLDIRDQWFPFIIVLGEEKRFLKVHGDLNSVNNELIQNYITWDKNNPVSIIHTVRSARENARIIRDIISSDLWEAINTLWLWLISNRSYNLYVKDQMAFYRIILSNISTIYGILYSSMSEDEAYHFMKLGMMLERANQTARIVDVKSHRISFYEISRRENVIETLYWLNLLKIFSAHEAFLKKSTTFNRKLVAQFLIFENNYPHTIAYCLDNACESLQKLKEITCVTNELNNVEVLLNQISESNIETILKQGLNTFLTSVINGIARICEDIESKFFDPELLFITQSKGHRL